MILGYCLKTQNTVAGQPARKAGEVYSISMDVALQGSFGGTHAHGRGTQRGWRKLKLISKNSSCNVEGMDLGTHCFV